MRKSKHVSDTFCVLPWIHLSTRPGGSMRVCCTANASSVGPTNDKEHGGMVGVLKNIDGKPSNLAHTSLLDAWNNDYMKNVRMQMMNGEKPASCLKCYKEEASGHLSKRNWETDYWDKRLDIDELISDTGIDGSVPAKLYYVDLRLGSKCNLKCVMCSPSDSSLWIPDWMKLYPKIENPILKDTMQWQKENNPDGFYNWYKDNPTFWDELYQQIPHMKQLYFAGGEPLIIDEHYSLLKEVIKQGYAKNIELRYNSNGTEFPEDLFELWNQFKRVRFHFSMDSIGEMNHYIRYPTDWDLIQNNLRLLDNTGDNVEITIACTTQLLNIFYVPDFIKWKLQQGYKKINPYPLGAGLINQHFLYHPPHFNVKVLPQWFKDQTEQKYEEFYVWLQQNYRNDDEFNNHNYGIKRLQGIIKFMQSEDWSNRLPETKEYLEKLDSVRMTNWKSIFPEMKDIFNGI